MSLDIVDGNVVHYPQRRNVFCFDEEVSRIFPDMAMRSIPMYEEAHRLHVSLFAHRIGVSEKTVFYDIGASRGHFFKALCNRFQINYRKGSSRLDCTAVDMSFPMLTRLHEEMPWVKVIEADIVNMPDFQEPADFICMFYLLQFLETTQDKMKALQWAYRNLKTGGVLFLGQKDKIDHTHADLFTEEYYRFRMENGYSMEEIRAKTEALKGSMWPCSQSWLEDMCLHSGFSDYVETTRWMQFSTSMCVK